jgi:hypothetical protein
VHCTERLRDENMDIKQAVVDSEPTLENSKLNLLNIWLMWISPKYLFKIAAKGPNIVLPILIIIIATTTINIITANGTDWEATFLVEQSTATLSDEQAQYMINQAKRFKYLSPIANVVLIPFGIFLLSGVFFLLLKIYGSSVSFNQLMSVILLALLPPIATFSILKAMLLIGQPLMSVDQLDSLVRSNITDLFSLELNALTSIWVKSLDIFYLWSVWLLVSGISTVAKLKTGTALMIVLVCSAIYLIGKSLVLWIM